MKYLTAIFSPMKGSKKKNNDKLTALHIIILPRQMYTRACAPKLHLNRELAWALSLRFNHYSRAVNRYNNNIIGNRSLLCRFRFYNGITCGGAGVYRRVCRQQYARALIIDTLSLLSSPNSVHFEVTLRGCREAGKVRATLFHVACKSN